jgi:xanthine/uracil permease
MKIVHFLVFVVFGLLAAWLLGMSFQHWSENISSQGFSMAGFSAIIAANSGKRFFRKPQPVVPKKPSVRPEGGYK